MTQFLSPDWFAASQDQPANTETAVVVLQVVTDTPWGDLQYVAEVSETGTRRCPGPVETPDLQLTTDYATAVEVHEGSLTITSALLAGRVKVRGDVARLTTLTRAIR